MNIFILEDDIARYGMMIEVLREVFPGCTIISSPYVDESKLLLEVGNPDGLPWDIISLDHDLGGEHFVNSDEEETGYQLAKWIKEKDIKFKKCIIHSMNFVGASKMHNEIPSSYYLPAHLWIPENIQYIWEN